jgi:hypothetical protein
MSDTSIKGEKWTIDEDDHLSSIIPKHLVPTLNPTTGHTTTTVDWIKVEKDFNWMKSCKRSCQGLRGRWSKIKKLRLAPSPEVPSVSAAFSLVQLQQPSTVSDDAGAAAAVSDAYTEVAVADSGAELQPQLNSDSPTPAPGNGCEARQPATPPSVRNATPCARALMPQPPVSTYNSESIMVYKECRDPDKSIFIFGRKYGCMQPHQVQAMVRNVWQLDPSAHGGCRDQRSFTGAALKGESGKKSTHKGYGTQTGTRWLVSEHQGLPTEVVMDFDELFNCELMVSFWSTGVEGRPPLPEDRLGQVMITESAEKTNVQREMAWNAVQAKRIANPEAAAEDEACTEPTVVEVTTGGMTVERLTLDIRLCGAWSPGITGETQNAEPLIEGDPIKPEKEGAQSMQTRHPSTYRLSSAFPPPRHKSAHAHVDDADKVSRRVAHMGLKHSSHSVLFLWAYDPYKLMVGGEFNVVVADPTPPCTVAKSGASLHVSPHNALLWVGHASKYWHMATRVWAVRQTTPSEPDVIDALQPGIRTRADISSSEQKGKVIGVRGTNVFHASECPIVSNVHAQRKAAMGKPAAALTAKQKRWRVLMGIAPLNLNERTRASLKELRKQVGHYPVNGPRDEITVPALAPYFERANAARASFYALGAELASCADDDEYEDARWNGEEDGSDGGEDGEEDPADDQTRQRKKPQRYV